MQQIPPTLALPPSQFARVQPHAYLLAHLDPKNESRPSLRPDGRTRTQFRPASINTGSLTHANGSAVVRIGEQAAVCGVRAELLYVDDIASWKVNAPEDSERKVEETRRNGGAGVGDDDDKEIRALNLLVPNLSLNTGCMPSVQPGTAPGPLAQTVSHELASVLHTSRLVRLDDLRIMYHPPDLTKIAPEDKPSKDDGDTKMADEGEDETGSEATTAPETKAFWTLYIDILMISSSGNPFDIAWTAMVAALKNTRLPKAWWDMDREMILCSDKVSESRPLQLRGCPISSSFAVFESDPAIEWRAVTPEGPEDEGNVAGETKRDGEKRWLLADPDAFEESLCNERVTVVVDAKTNDADASKLKIIKLVKNGGLAVGPKTIHDVVGLAGERWKELNQLLESV
ncbi:hypothetical protein KEM55_007598 [Ascosphaera atra]|nr:hypothetical protein KEM55_007598 [Ascosphaera atra]